jgi:O-methyltransferase domain
MNALSQPDPATLTWHLRAMYRSRLLVAAVHHLRVFELLAAGSLPLPEFQRQLNLKERPAMVLIPSLAAMGLIDFHLARDVSLTARGRLLTSASTPNLVGYLGLEAEDPGVVEMARRVREDGSSQTAQGTAFVKDGTEPSPMDDPESARFLTLALSGRARLLAPLVAAALPQVNGHLLDVAGGTGLFAYEWLRINPKATATVLDRGPVLAVAAEFLDEFCRGADPNCATVKDRVRLQPGDMLEDELPQSDLILAASLFHDWPGETCRLLARRFAEALQPGGQLWAHDAFLDDTLDGPLPVTDYSAQLFWFTKGRCYSRREYYGWMTRAGLSPTAVNLPTQMDYSLISATNDGR